MSKGEFIVKQMLVLVAVVAMASGCTGRHIARTKATVEATFNCPAEEQRVTEVHNGWLSDGCGRKVLCRSSTGPCFENLSYADKLARARFAFARDTQCPIADITIEPRLNGYGGQGCGRYALCSSYDGPCMPASPPTCAEMAQERHEVCVQQAHAQGNEGRRDARNNYAGLALSIGSTVSENIATDECRNRLNADLSQCGPR